MGPWTDMKRCSGGFETFERSFKTSGNVKGRRAWAVVWLLQIPCWMICVKGHVEADRDKGQAFRAEWAFDCWLTRCLLFCFLNDAGSRPHCDLWWNGLSATCGLWKTLEKQDVFRKVSPHQKQERWCVSPFSRQCGHGESEGMPSYSPLFKTRAK